MHLINILHPIILLWHLDTWLKMDWISYPCSNMPSESSLENVFLHLCEDKKKLKLKQHCQSVTFVKPLKHGR